MSKPDRTYLVISLVFIAVISLVAVGVLYYSGRLNTPTNSPTTNSGNQTNNQGQSGTNPKTYTVLEVSQQGTAETNCLIIYRDKVYKVPTTYFEKHPGGTMAILNACGTDATVEFDSAHNPGGPALSMFQDYFVGNIVK